MTSNACQSANCKTHTTETSMPTPPDKYKIIFTKNGETMRTWTGYFSTSEAKRDLREADLIIPLDWLSAIVPDMPDLKDATPAETVSEEDCPSCGGAKATRETWEAVEGGSLNIYWRITCPCGHRDTNDIFS